MFCNEITFTETQLNKIEWKYLLRMTNGLRPLRYHLLKDFGHWKLATSFLDQITRKYVPKWDQKYEPVHNEDVQDNKMKPTKNKHYEDLHSNHLQDRKHEGSKKLIRYD